MDPLAQLNDIHTPQAVDIWPLAWGWWACGMVLVLLVSLLVWQLIKRVRFNRARREACRIHRSIIEHSDYPAAANQLLKRVALHYFEPSVVAAVYGSDWQTLLLRRLPARYHDNVTPGLSLLTEHVYQNTNASQADRASITSAIDLWLRKANLRKPLAKLKHPEEHTHV